MGCLRKAVAFSFSPLVPEDLTHSSVYNQHLVKVAKQLRGQANQ